MEKKNTVLLTVIAVATLLVAVVGATFAYFTATATGNGNGGKADVTTTTVGNVDLKMSPVTITNELKYPGGHLVVGAEVVAKDTDTAIDFDAKYTVNGTITNNTKTALTWTLYEVSTASTNPISGCTVQETANGTETQYKYTGCTVDTAITGGTSVKTGTVAAATTTGEGDSAVTTPGTATITAADEVLTTSNAGKTTYYYLVVDYPDNGNQNADQGKSVVAEITGLTAGSAVEHK